MAMIRVGCSTSLFQGSQHWSTMSSKDLNIRFEGQLSRMNCQTFSCGFSYGHFAGNGMSVILGGTVSRPERRQPA